MNLDSITKNAFPPLGKCLVLVLLLAPFAVRGDGFLDEDLSYRFDGSTTRVYVYGLRNSSATHITIPATVVYEYTDRDDGGNYKVKYRTCTVASIGSAAFTCCSGLTSVTIPSSVTSIGASAFYCCSGLTSVTIPSSVTSVGDSAFGYCSGLTSVTIGDGVTNIGDYAFYSCSGLTNVVIGNSVTNIGREAFRDCGNVRSVTVPQYVLDSFFITDYADPRQGIRGLFKSAIGNITNVSFSSVITNIYLSDCSGLTSVTIPSSVTSIGDYAFEGCSGLTSVTIPNSVTSIGDYAFDGCSGLTSVTIPNSVTSIGDLAFDGCSGLTSVTIPNSVTSIGDYAFYGCSGLTSVTIPSSVTSVGDSAFSSCSGLTSVTIGNGVTSIGKYAFSYCSGLTSVTIPSSVTSIGDHAFYRCSGLTSVTIPQYVVDKSLSSVFPSSLQSLREITFSDNVTYISEECCKGFTNLEKVCIPDSVTEIEENAFETCGNIVDVTLPWRPNLKVSKLFPDSYRKIKKITFVGEKPDRIPDGAFEGCESLEEIEIPDTVRDVGASAFKGCKAFKELPALPTGFAGVTNIGASAFADCTGLEAVDWSWWPLIDEIPASLFKGCTNLKRVEGVPSSVGRIGASAFEDCESLTRMLLPASVTDMGTKVFQGCSGLTDVQLPPSIERVPDYTFNGCASLTGVTMPSSPITIGKGAFFGCNQMMGITIPESVTRIGDYAFGDCWRLGGLAIPDGVGAVPEGMCYECRRLNDIILPESVTKVGSLAFYGCTSLTNMVLPGAVMELGDNAFSGCASLSTISLEDRTGRLSVASNSIPASASARVSGREGYSFIGWADENGMAVSDPFHTNVKITVIPVWQHANDGGVENFMLTLDLNGGSQGVASNSVTVIAGSVLGDGALPKPVRLGYAFDGWWTAKIGGVKVTEETVFLIGIHDTLYAHWISNAYLVINTEESYDTDSDGSFTLVLADVVFSGSTPKLTVKGLPTGIKYDSKTMTISGMATKPGTYKVTVSATNATVTKPVTAEFEIVVPNLRSDVMANLDPEKDAYGTIYCGVAFDPSQVDCTPRSGWTVKVAGLPSGLKYDAKTGLITGVPTKAGTFTVTFTASKKGEANQVATITLRIAALPDWSTGTFTGYVAGTWDARPYYGSATMTVAANGKVSGKIALDGTNWTFSAASYAVVECPSSDIDEASFIVNATAKAGKATLPVMLAARSASGPYQGATLVNGTVDGTFGEGEVQMWRNMWKDKATAAAAKAEIAKWEGVYTISFDDGGYMSLTVGKNGDVKAAGKLSDGTSASATAPLMFHECWNFFTVSCAAPSAYKGGFVFLPVGFGAERGRLDAIGAGAMVRSRNPQATGEYGAGFERQLAFTGAYYDKAKKLNDYYGALRLSMDAVPSLAYTYKETYMDYNGKKATDSYAYTQNAVDTLWQEGCTVAVNAKGQFDVVKATKPVQDKDTKEWFYDGANDGAMSLSFTQATGIFKGSYTFWYDYLSAYDDTKGKETPAHTSKKVSFEGVMVQGEDALRGFYLWDATGTYTDAKTGKPKTYKYKVSYPMMLQAQ